MTFLYFFSCECAHSSVKSSQTSGLNVWIRSATGNAIADDVCAPACSPPDFSFLELPIILPRSTMVVCPILCFWEFKIGGSAQRRLPHCWCRNEHIRGCAACCPDEVLARS